MTSVDLVLDRARAAGVRIWADAGRLRFEAPAGAIDENLRGQLRVHKPQLLEILAETPDGDPRSVPARRRRMEPVLRALAPAVEQFRTRSRKSG